MTALPIVVATRGAGANLAAAGCQQATASDTFPAGPNSFLRVRNTTAGPITVTVTPPAGAGPLGTSITGYALAPAVELTTGDRMYGPFPAYPFGDANGNVTVTYSSFAAGVTAQCVQATD
jgi:hypothetical protein